MKVWMFGLGLALLCSVCAEHKCSGNDRYMEGTWHVIGIGTSSLFPETKIDTMKMLFAWLSFPEEGKLKVTSNFPTEDGCKMVEIEFEKMEDGTYYHTSESSKISVEIVKTNCQDYAIAIVKIEKNDMITTIVTLYSKNTEVSPEVKEQLTAIGESQGLTSEQIVFFPVELACQDEE
ncbi:extracellular fatty acid-binding protein-like [Paroedura picta]|uniref:extracellular fatty acid-binding protein-like n=1 Tax=Paroedura picta TaxID=143630 RepID=UPI0040568356